MSQVVSLTGLTGSRYDFVVCEYFGSWKDVGGIYAFVGADPQGDLRVHYIGKADSFRNRMSGHEKWISAWHGGATHVLARVNSNALSRGAEEQDLIRSYNPQLNDQYRTDNRNLGDVLAEALMHRKTGLGGW